MKLFCKILLLLFPTVVFSQHSGDKPVSSKIIWEVRATNFRFSHETFTFCDTDSDGLLSINLESIKDVILNENIQQFGTDAGIYISTRLAKVHLITNINDNTHKTTICDGSLNLGGYGMLDIAVNQENEMYVSAVDKIYKLNNTNCSVESEIDLGLNGLSITSLSFDRQHNMYLGGFDSSVYKLNNGQYGSMQLWKNFDAGFAAGDFVMCKDKMYIAWRLGPECRLYEVTVDANMNYLSHIDLGGLPDNTYGLASELGKLYGVTPSQLYKINSNPLTFQPVLNNNDLNDDWYGAAGKNEAVNFEVTVYASMIDAQNNQNALPNNWTNTIAGGQTVYVVIKNTVNNQSVTVPANITVDAAPSFNNPQHLVNCETDANANVFNIRSTEIGIVGDQSNIVVSYHANFSDASNNVNALSDVYSIDGNPTDIAVRLTNAVTGCFSTFSFALEIAPKPNFNQPDNMVFCASANHFNVVLTDQNTQILGNQNAEDVAITYYSSFEDAFDGIQALFIPYQMHSNVKEIFVRIENVLSGCFDMGSFLVKLVAENNDFPVNYNVEINDWSGENNSIQVIASGNYEYSLDGIVYHDNPYFDGLAVGEHQLHVRDKDNCSVSIKAIFLMMYPKYFTPNGDGYNDSWNVILASHEPNMKIEVYDRYGKMITTLTGKNLGWDGSLNGRELPASDYWFTVTRENGKTFKGHFTLKR
jgi:gliding motility-associated-like protein